MWGVRKYDVLFERQSQTSPPLTKWRGKSFESILLKPIWEIFDRLLGRFEFFHCNIDQPNFNVEKCSDQTFVVFFTKLYREIIQHWNDRFNTLELISDIKSVNMRAPVFVMIHE